MVSGCGGLVVLSFGKELRCLSQSHKMHKACRGIPAAQRGCKHWLNRGCSHVGGSACPLHGPSTWDCVPRYAKQIQAVLRKYGLKLAVGSGLSSVAEENTDLGTWELSLHTGRKTPDSSLPRLKHNSERIRASPKSQSFAAGLSRCQEVMPCVPCHVMQIPRCLP